MSAQIWHGGFAPARARARSFLHRLHGHRPAALLAIWDCAVILLCGFACRELNPPGHAAHTPREILVILGTAILAVGFLYRDGVYERPHEPCARAWLRPLMPVLHAFALMLLALLLWEGLTGLWQGPAPAAMLANRNWLFAWALSAPALLLLSRDAAGAAWQWSAPARPGRRAVLVGDGGSAARLAAFMEGRDAVRIVGFLSIGGAMPVPPGGWPVLRGLRAACALIQAGEADLVIVALPEAASRRIAAILRRMAGMAVDIRLAPDIARFYRPDARVSSIGGLPLSASAGQADARVWRRRPSGPRIFAICLPLLCLAAPLMLLIALAIRLDITGAGAVRAAAPGLQQPRHPRAEIPHHAR